MSDRVPNWSAEVWDGRADITVEWPDSHALAKDWWSHYEANGRFADDTEPLRPISVEEDAADSLLAFIEDQDPERAMDLVVVLAETAPDRESLFFLGAGPLEDLFRSHGDVLAQRLVDAANESNRFRIALSGVWPDRRAPLSDRAMRLLQPYLGDDETTPFA